MRLRLKSGPIMAIRRTLLVAAAGAIAGLVITARGSGACDCPSEAWKVQLRAVISDPPAESHGRFWPSSGDLTSYTGGAQIWAPREPGKATRIGAGR